MSRQIQQSTPILMMWEEGGEGVVRGMNTVYYVGFVVFRCFVVYADWPIKVQGEYLN